MENLNDEHLQQIAKACIKLEKVSLCFHKYITDEGIIKSFFTYCSRLKYLQFRGCEKVTGICLTQLPASLKSLIYHSLYCVS